MAGTARNGCKGLEMAVNGWNQIGTPGISWTWLKMAENCWN